MEHARERRQVLAMSLIALGAGVRLRIGVNFISRERVKRGLGGSVWESNPPFDPRRAESPALKAGNVTGRFSPPRAV
jgi:hypothetical protein